MSDELIVCIVILILSAIIIAISTIYICALLAVTRAEEYQKDERDIIRDPADIIRRIPGEIKIISIEARGENYGDVERKSD